MLRDQYCGQFSTEQMGTEVQAAGWINTKRDMGGVLFVDLKDKTGILQIVFDCNLVGKEQFEKIEKTSNQSVIQVKGILAQRDSQTRNPKIATGEIELRVKEWTLLSGASPLPFSLEDNVKEELRLKYRYLDLRRQELQDNLRFRYLVQHTAENFLNTEGFTSVETPILTKSTPEGARDYLVPSRVHPGSFYALPQSPQIFKQLLMVGGVDRYYQIARCFRDEDLRADRQPEFTQVDMELSFVEQEDILQLLEKMMKSIVNQVCKQELTEDFLRMTWQEAMDCYGTDKPDLRFELPIVELSEVLAKSSFQLFAKVLEQGGVVRGITVKGGADFTRGDIDLLTRKAQQYGAKGMAWIALLPNGEVQSILTKYFTEQEMDTLFRTMKAEAGDFILFCADELEVVREVLGRLRLDLADLRNLRQAQLKFLFVTDFPQFEYSKEEERYLAAHHPFTMPNLEDLDYLQTQPQKVRAQAYDLVLNGVELGSGSIRIHDSEIQKKMFSALGFSQQEIQERFGFFVEAFKYGTPPHGGFAFGLDRLVMLLLGAKSLREVIAFPKTGDASCPLTYAPSMVDLSQLEELGLGYGVGDIKVSSGADSKQKQSPKIDVDKVASLAKLKLNDLQKQQMEEEMSHILEFANCLNEIDTTGVEPAAHSMAAFNVLRADQCIDSQDRSWVLQGVPSAVDGYIQIPQQGE